MFIFPYGLILSVIALILIFFFKLYAVTPRKRQKWERREAIVIIIAFICGIVTAIWLR